MDYSPANRALAYPSPAAFRAGMAAPASVVTERRRLGGQPENDAVSVGLEGRGDDLARLGVRLLRLGNEPPLLDQALNRCKLCGRQARGRRRSRFFRHVR